MGERWLGPREMATRLGVSPKALRVYEREGLTKPLRTSAGWRAYGPAHAEQLHKILALKALGLPLKRIAELLAGDVASLDQVLEVQERRLRDRHAETQKALALLAAARSKLKSAGALTFDELTQLTKETVMTDTPKLSQAWGEALQPLVDKHFDDDLKSRLREAQTAVTTAGYDQASIQREWEAIFAEARTLLDAGDETSPRACELARRWDAMAAMFTRRDPEISAKAQAVWTEAMADPDIAPRLPGVPDLFRYVGRVVQGMAARGEPISKTS